MIVFNKYWLNDFDTQRNYPCLPKRHDNANVEDIDKCHKKYIKQRRTPWYKIGKNIEGCDSPTSNPAPLNSNPDIQHGITCEYHAVATLVTNDTSSVLLRHSTCQRRMSHHYNRCTTVAHSGPRWKWSEQCTQPCHRVCVKMSVSRQATCTWCSLEYPCPICVLQLILRWIVVSMCDGLQPLQQLSLLSFVRTCGSWWHP